MSDQKIVIRRFKYNGKDNGAEVLYEPTGDIAICCAYDDYEKNLSKAIDRLKNRIEKSGLQDTPFHGLQDRDLERKEIPLNSL